MPRAAMRISSKLLVDLFKAGPARVYRVVGDGLPEDTRLVNSLLMPGETVLLILDSDAFPQSDDPQALLVEVAPVLATLTSLPPLPDPGPLPPPPLPVVNN